MMKLTLHVLLLGFLTSVAIASAQAGEGGCECPSGPPGAPHFGPPTSDHRFGPGDGHFRPPQPLAEFDQDKDGRVSRAEIDRVLKARFEAADLDHNGALDRDEFERARQQLHAGEGGAWGPMTFPPPPRTVDDEEEDRPLPPPGFARHNHAWGPPDPAREFKRLDWNLDGELSFGEFAAPIREIATRLDRNGDGVIEQDELKGPCFAFGPGFGPPPPPPPRDR